MTLAPLLSAPFAVQLHAGAALLAVVIGPLAIHRRRRDRLHRVAGYAWVTAMAVAALSAFSIEAQVLGIRGYGPIHLLAALALVSLAIGVRHARAGQIARHEAEFRSLYRNALGIAGLLTLLPGRRINAALFGENEMAGVAVICAVFLLWLLRRGLPSRQPG